MTTTISSKPNALTIGAGIILATPKGTMAGFTWDGEKLIHAGTGKTLRFCESVSRHIAAAIEAYRKGRVELCESWESRRPAAAEGWEFERVLNDTRDANGDRWCEYSRYHKGAEAVEVRFGKEDLR